MKRIHTFNIGSLTVPSEDVIKVCKKAETTIRSLQPLDIRKLNRAVITKFCLPTLLIDQFLFRDLRLEFEDEHTLDSNHVMNLIKEIIGTYSSIRLHYIAKQLTLA